MTDNPGISLGSAFAGIHLDLAGLKDDINKAKQTFSSGLKDMGADMSSTGRTMISAFAPLTAVFGLAAKASNDHAEALGQLNAVLKSTGGAAGVTRDAVLNLAKELENSTNYSDEAVISAQNLLLTFGQIKSKTFPEVTKAVLDMATSMRIDLRSAALMVGKAMQSPVDGVTSLQRNGVRLTEEQKELVRQMVAVGDTAGAQALIVKELGVEFGGSAEAAANSGNGFAQLTNTINDLMVSVGDALAPAIKDLTKQLKPIIASISEWVSKNPRLILTVAGVAAGMTVLGTVLFTVGNALSGIGGLLELVNLPLLALAVASGILYAAWQSDFGGIQEVVKPIFDEIGNTLSFVGNLIGSFVQDIGKVGLLEAIKHLFGMDNNGESVFASIIFAFTKSKEFAIGLTDFIRQAFTSIQPFIDGVVNTIRGFIGGIGDGLKALSAGASIGDVLSKWASTFMQWVTEIPQTFITPLLNAFSGLLGKVGDWLSGSGPGQLATGLGDLFKGIVDWIRDTGWPKFKEGVSNLFDSVKGFLDSEGFHKFTDGLGSILTQAAEWFLKTGVPMAVTGLGNLFKGITDWLGKTGEGGAGQFIKGIGDAIQQAWNWLTTTGIQNAIKAFEQLVTMIKPTIDKIGQMIIDTVTNAVNNVLTSPGLLSIFSPAGGLMQGVQNSIAKQQIAGHADGSPLVPGWNMLGEKGPELLWSDGGGGSQVFTADQSRSMMNSSSTDKSITFAPGSIVIYANEYGQGESAGDKFARQLESALNGRG